MSAFIEHKRRRLAAFRAALSERQPLFGCFSALASPGWVEALGYSSLDFLVLDMEHGPSGAETVENLLRGADAAGTNAFVRVPAGRPDLVATVMDSGAAGLMLPMVERVEQLDRVRDAMRFAPLGRRGVAPNVRAGAYGFMSLPDFYRWGNEETLLIAQLETGMAVDNAAALCSHPVVDVVFIGTNDLSTSLGHFGELDHPVVVDAVDEIIAAAKKAGVPIGSVATTPVAARAWIEQGVTMVILSSMLGFRAYDAQVAAVRSATAS